MGISIPGPLTRGTTDYASGLFPQAGDAILAPFGGSRAPLAAAGRARPGRAHGIQGPGAAGWIRGVAGARGDCMPKSMLVNVTAQEEHRVAIVDNGVLDIFEIETLTREHLKGDIFKAIVEVVNPALEASLV